MRVFVNNLSTPLCDACAQGIAKQHIFKQIHKAAAVLKLIYIDVSEFISIMFFSKQYYMIFKNDYTSFRKLYFIKIKNETAKHFEKYKNLIKNQLDIKIKCLQSNEGDKYVETEFMNILKDIKIQ